MAHVNRIWMALLFSAAAAETQAGQRERSHWAHVERLEPGTPIVVILRDGVSLTGVFGRVDGDRLRILCFDGSGLSQSERRRMLAVASSQREALERVDSEGKQVALAPILRHVMRGQVEELRRPIRRVAGKVVGALLGIPLGAVSGAMIGSKLPSSESEFPGLEGAVYGFLIGAPLGGVLGGVLGAKVDRNQPPFEVVYRASPPAPPPGAADDRGPGLVAR
jgi:hypothetical protein